MTSPTVPSGCRVRRLVESGTVYLPGAVVAPPSRIARGRFSSVHCDRCEQPDRDPPLKDSVVNVISGGITRR